MAKGLPFTDKEAAFLAELTNAGVEFMIVGLSAGVNWGQIYFLFQRGQLAGCKGFQETVEKRMGRRVELRGRGRPRSQEK